MLGFIEFNNELLLKEKVERIESFENNIGVTFGNVSFTYTESEGLSCFMELGSSQYLNEDIEVHIVLYDTDGDIFLKDDTLIIAEDFQRFEVLKFNFYNFDQNLINQIGRILIYPK